MKTKTPNVSGRSAWLRDNITKYFRATPHK